MKLRTKLLHEGEYAVEVTVELLEPGPGWETCLSLQDALKLDKAREALRAGDVKKASQLGRVFRLVPFTA